MKIHFTITTDSPYPISTKGTIQCNGWQIAARQAVNEHKKCLREKQKLRKWGEKTIITLLKLPEDHDE